MQYKLFKYLPIEAREIRERVFVQEQGFEEEFDSVDNIAAHILAYDENKVVATCRFFNQGDYYLIGRIAVIKECRGSGVGREMIRYAEEQIKLIGGKEIRIHAQLRAQGFYSKLGYLSTGDCDYDEGCEHIWMYKIIRNERGK